MIVRGTLLIALALAALLGVLPAGASAAPGTEWTSHTTPVVGTWQGVAYGNGIFVAVANGGTDAHVMTSPDGITWTARTAPEGNWEGIAFGNGLFVAVSGSSDPTANRVITSPDGITWTARTPADDTGWDDVTWGGGQFVAVGFSGSGNRVMTSPDGITWTGHAAAAAVQWHAVTYANGLYVAVAGRAGSIPTRVMTSPDGVTWTSRTSTNLNNWYAVTYGAGLFVALSGSYDNGDQVMTSPDGVTWTARTAASLTKWRSVVYAEGEFVAVGLYDVNISTATVMTSPDGITWTPQTAASNDDWKSLAYESGVFVAVAMGGTGDRLMTSGLMVPGAPTTPTAIAGNRQATVMVSRGTTGGAPASYTVTALPGGRTCVITAPATSCVMTGLTNRTAYTFTATATNATGTSGASAASTAVTPRGPLVVRTRVTASAITSSFTAAEPGTVAQHAVRTGSSTRAAGITVCSTTRKIAKPDRATLTCALTAAARRLRQQGAVRVMLTTTLTLADGSTLVSSKALILPRTAILKASPTLPSAVTG
ncbi:MAG: hypothetical protein ACR2J9_01525 [Gaiellales bacterium]